MQQDLIDDQSALVQIMALVLSGNKPLPEPMFVDPDLCHHIYAVIKPQ